MFTRNRSAHGTFARGLALTLTLTLVVAGSGCKQKGTSAVDQLDPDGLNDRSIVVALGDSITFGVLDTNVPDCGESNRGAGGFCPPLEALASKTVINEGKCGEDSFDGVDRIDSVLRRWRPSVILLDYSPNDLFHGPHGTALRLRIMVDAALKNHTVPIIGTLIPATSYHAGWEAFITTLNPLILELCAEKGLECADHHAAFVNDPGYMADPFALLTEDGEHPNHAGYLLMAETWNKSLQRVY